MSANEIKLESFINPEGVMTTGWFEYTTDPYFANWSETEHKIIGAGRVSTPLRETLENLEGGRTYYYRLAFDNGESTTKGPISSFQTQATYTQSSTNSTSSNSSNLSANAISATNQNYIYTDGQNLAVYQNAANSLLAGSFLPQGLSGWLIVILLVLGIVSLVKKISKVSGEAQA